MTDASSKPRVLYVSKALVVSAYRAKLRALSRHARVRALVPERWGDAEVEPLGGLHGPARIAFRRPLFHGHNHLHLYPGLGSALDGDGPDLVHIDEEPFSAVTFQLALLCRRRGIPALFFSWENLDKWIPPPFAALRDRVYRWVDGAIAGTDRAAEVLRDTGYRGPLAVIPQFGIDPERFRPDEGARTRTRKKLGLGCDDFVVGFAGRLVPEKGVEALLDAASATEGTTVVFIGEGPLREALESRARSGKDGVRARFVGRVPSPAIPRWLNGLDALVLPSRDAPRWSEQFGRVLVEAMACGVPVVGTDSGEIPRVIGDAGVVVAGAGARALAGALRSLRDDPGRRRALGEAGRRRALERFTNDRIARKTAAFYAELLTERQPSWAS